MTDDTEAEYASLENEISLFFSTYKHFSGVHANGEGVRLAVDHKAKHYDQNAFIGQIVRNFDLGYSGMTDGGGVTFIHFDR